MRKTKMRLCALAIVVISLGITSTIGCNSRPLQAAIDAFTADHPAAGVIAVDNDGDGMPEFFAPDMDGDKKADTDEAGKIIEIAGTKQILADAAQMDTDMVDIITIIGEIGGVGGIAGLFGAWWGRRKPIQRLNTVVRSFEKARIDDTPEGFVAFSRDTLKTIQKELPELKALIDAIREKG